MSETASSATSTPEPPPSTTPAGSGPPLIEVQGLTKLYRDFRAVSDVSFSLGKGQIVGFLGPNGAGKSTTMRMLVGAIPATAGTAKVCGFDVFEQPLEVKRRIGYLPEIPPVYFDLTVEDQLKFGCSLKGLTGADAQRSIERSVERCRLHEHFKRLVGNLSKGFRQRVGLAQALLGDPDVLILDEPTVGLDPRQIQDVRNLIGELAGDHTVILSTHILQEVKMVCERMIMIRRGEIVVDDTLAAIEASHPGKTVEEIFLQLTED